MAVEIKQVAQWLEAKGIQFHIEEEKDLIYFGATSDSSESAVKTGHYIRTKEDGKMFSYEVQIIRDGENWSIEPDHKYIEKILKYILRENYNSKFGTWEYDYKDGDIKFCVEIPLEDTIMTEKMFERVLSMTMGNLDNMAKNVIKIYETGEIPEDDGGSTDDLLKKLLLMKMIEDGDVDEFFGSSKSSNDSDSSKKKDDDWSDGI